jgi:hypothetical protein
MCFWVCVFLCRRYFGLLINVNPDRLVIPYQSYTLDW